MKNKIKILIFNYLVILSLFCFSFLIKSSSGYDSKYLNKDFAPNYYNGLDTNQDSDDFKKDLSVIISTGYIKKGYSELATLYKKSDVDPNNTSNVLCLYTKNSLSGESASAGGWDREHVWAKSHGFPANQTFTDENGNTIKYENTEPYTDAHHLRPATSKINQTRLDYDFAEIDDNEELIYKDDYGNKISKNLKLFEPADHCKGDVARMLLYMDTRYGYTYPFNLQLVDNSTSTSNGNGRVGKLQTLLKWHYQDPVDDSEIYRNNVIYDIWQNNRNPYIDHPEYVAIAYPNTYALDSIDNEKVNNVISLINELPSTITLEQELLVNNARTLYEELNTNEKHLIKNIDILLNAEFTIKLLNIEKFTSLEAKSSFIVTYNSDLQPTNVDLRFGGIIPKSMYDIDAKYGVIVTKNYSDKIEGNKYENQTISDFINNHPEYKNISTTPVCVNETGIEDPTGEYYQFAWLITDMEGNYNTILKSMLYVEYNGNLYISNSKSFSVSLLAKYYYEHKEELNLTTEQISVVNILMPHYIGSIIPGDIEKDFWN